MECNIATFCLNYSKRRLSMDLFSLMSKHSSEQMSLFFQREIDLKILLVFGDRMAQQSFAGVRMFNYGFIEQAVLDAMKLARAMA